MSGLRITQINHYDFHYKYKFAITKTNEMELSNWGFSRVKGVIDNSLWNSTIRTISTSFYIEFE